MNKLKLIHTENYLLAVSNKEIKEGDWYLDDTDMVRQSVTSDEMYWSVRQDYMLITHHLPLNNAPMLDNVPLLPDPELVIIDELAEKHWDNIDHNQFIDGLNLFDFSIGFRAGYDAATKRFSEEDIAKAITFGQWGGTTKKDYEEFIQSLEQPKYPKWFIVETKEYIYEI
jgi:hypothetical protein